MKKRIIYLFIAAILLFSCTACQGDYSYTEKLGQVGYDPESYFDVKFSSFYDIKQAYVAAGKGVDAFEEYCASQEQGSFSNSQNNRDIFLSFYFAAAEYPVLISKNTDIEIHSVRMIERNSAMWKGELQYAALDIDYHQASTGDVILHFFSFPQDADFQPFEELCIEKYDGDGFQAWLYEIEGEAYRIIWWCEDGEACGYIGATYHDLQDAKEDLQCLDNFKVTTFHKAVQSAKEPK